MPAASSTRVLWKGAIAFGLVHIPIALHSAVQNQSIDFDWLDKRSMEPVGYKRINKITGKEIERENIVKGVASGDGEYVVLEAEEIQAAYPRTTQTVEIEAFVPLKAIPFVYLERPYYVAPINKGGKVYALLREALAESGMAGVAKVVIQTRQHLALLFACGPVLILNLLRWGDEVRDWSALNLPEKGAKSAGLSDREMRMARQLVSDMTIEWEPKQFTDSFREQIMQLVQEKIEAGETEQVTQPEPEETEARGSARIYDLTEMLQKSLQRGDTSKRRSTPRDDGDDDATETRSRVRSAAQSTTVGASKGASKRTSKTAAKATVKNAAKTASKATVKNAAKTAAKTTAKAASKSSPKAATKSSSATASKSGATANSKPAASKAAPASRSKTVSKSATRALRKTAAKSASKTSNKRNGGRHNNGDKKAA